MCTRRGGQPAPAEIPEGVRVVVEVGHAAPLDAEEGEAGEDPEKIEEDMGDLLGDFMGGPDEQGGMGGGGGGYTHDSGLYDY